MIRTECGPDNKTTRILLKYHIFQNPQQHLWTNTWSGNGITYISVVDNFYMEDFVIKALRTAPRKLHAWLCYADDAFIIQHEYDIEGFTKHINELDSDINFTVKQKTLSRLQFLETLILLNTTEPSKHKCTGQYLNWKSNHHLEHKRSVVRTSLHEPEKVVSDENNKKLK